MALIRQLFRQTFECWWLWSSDHCLSCKIVWFDLDYGFWQVTVNTKIIVENEMQELRTQINNHLDKLQENMMKELTEVQKQITNDHCLSCKIVWFDLDYGFWQVTVNTCRVFPLLSPFALRKMSRHQTYLMRSNNWLAKWLKRLVILDKTERLTQVMLLAV
jgi:Zn-finger nucleic acid-binding protein